MSCNRGPSAEAESELLIERVVLALATDFTQRQLPHALAIQAEVSDGHALNAEDVASLTDMLDSLASASALFDQHPDLEALYRCAASLYDEIMTEAFVATSPKEAVAG
jgi:hypothetical protein